MARAVVQRARSGAVHVGGNEIGRIGRGLVILLGVGQRDEAGDIDRLADKVAVLRIFEDADGKMNLSAAEVGGAMLVVSQFTLYGDVRKGRRPSFVAAAAPKKGLDLYERFCGRLESHNCEVQRGQFGAEMLVTIENDGPVTLVLDSDAL